MDHIAQEAVPERDEFDRETIQVSFDSKVDMDIITRGLSKNEDPYKRAEENLELYKEWMKLADEMLPKDSKYTPENVSQYFKYILSMLSANGIRHTINEDTIRMNVNLIKMLQKRIDELEKRLEA